ncbi:DUF7573 domain-containing protein [Haloferax sulfurifontis]|uniref:DUF7573 domain-containing protein n=2 Tax=Haloferax sulfurifontis TaxID=255616 RepID=M0HXH7_9EURY|nr:zinc ribbon domain-containing protein [Haloferax sulfurifontis]ELZ89201.1 hypothetical protein C441_16939 [Haloferax sulfurifontis ATCC BAA-897]GGC69250.1 hypothetical protein GCM10007209_34100 [Haloferax sulfurifontis]
MPNRSLDDFAAGGDEPVDTPPSADEPADATDSVEADSRDVSTLATYRWTPEPAACPQCGESVQKRWLDGDEYVCLDCKDW